MKPCKEANIISTFCVILTTQSLRKMCFCVTIFPRQTSFSKVPFLVDEIKKYFWAKQAASQWLCTTSFVSNLSSNNNKSTFLCYHFTSTDHFFVSSPHCLNWKYTKCNDVLVYCECARVVWMLLPCFLS